MSESVLLGRGRRIHRLPWDTWKQHLARVPEHSGDRHRFMTEDFQRVRYFVVRELPLRERAITRGEISTALRMPPEQVEAILDELERKLFFLVRNEQGAVSWAYPVTIEPTPHHLSFSSGERLYAA
jgi:hypothetical protein